MTSLIRVDDARKFYGSGDAATCALDGVSFSIEEGDFVSIMGPSGCGKSTLLNLMAGHDDPTSGRILIDGDDLATLRERERSEIRLRTIGFIYQSFNLLPRLTVEQNLSWRLEWMGLPMREVYQRTTTTLERVGVPQAAWKRYPAVLSGGEQQRVATARALVTEPRLLLADEPTGNLDTKTGTRVLDLLREINIENKMTVVLVTHSKFAAMYGRRTIELEDGKIKMDVESDAPPPYGEVVALKR